jgi:predicted  nucleic acid-binding Zn-ribbon protein/cold shock CspA family protein
MTNEFPLIDTNRTIKSMDKKSIKREFVVDGTDIICNLTKERLLAPLLQLLLHLQQQEESFYCYFDADTRYKFDKDIDRQLYQSLIKFGLNDCFNQATGSDADRLILKQADDINSIIISANTFGTFSEDYEWLKQPNRILKPKVVDNQLVIENLDIRISLEINAEILVSQLVNALESERNHLHGVIDRYKSDRDFGFIRRHAIDKKIFFHKKSVTDANLNFTKKDTPVAFKVDIDNSGGIYYFCAIEVQERQAVSQDEVIEQLSAEREQLFASKSFLQQQAIELKNAFERELKDIAKQNETLLTDNEALKEQLSFHTSPERELIKRVKFEREEFNNRITNLEGIIKERNTIILALKKEIEQLNAQKKAALEALEQKVQESNTRALTIDVQQEKIVNLDEDLKATLRLMQSPRLDYLEALLYEELKQEHDILLKTIGHKNSQITFLNNNLQDLQSQVEQGSSPITKAPSEIEQLIDKVKDLENNNQKLKSKIQDLEKKKNQITNQAANETNETNETTIIEQGEILKIPEVEDFEQGKTSVVSLSEQAKQYRAKRPQKVIVEATRTELENWWYSLEEQWKIAFSQAVLNRGEVTNAPDEDQLRSLFKRKKIDIVGNGILFFGLNQLSIKLTNVSGLSELSQIEELNISGHDLKVLSGLNHLENLSFLNCTSNQISSMDDIQYLQKLKTLIIQDNDLFTLQGIEHLHELEYFNCLYNGRLTTIGKINTLSKLQVFKVDSYKTIIRLELEELEKINPKLELNNV